jgi:hypothetical protein
MTAAGLPGEAAGGEGVYLEDGGAHRSILAEAEPNAIRYAGILFGVTDGGSPVAQFLLQQAKRNFCENATCLILREFSRDLPR